MYILSCVPRRGHVKKEVITIENGKITAVRDNGSSADLVVRINNSNLAAVIMDKQATDVMLQIVDGRTLSLDQRRKIYATLRDISLYTGYTPEETKEVMKHVHITTTALPPVASIVPSPTIRLMTGQTILMCICINV